MLGWLHAKSHYIEKMKNAWVAVGVAVSSLIVGAGGVHAENPAHVQTLLRTNSCQDCDLSEISLSDLDLSDANLAGANLENTDLSGTQLSRANLKGANLTQATITNAVFTGANLQDATLAAAKNSGLCQGNFLTGFSASSKQGSTCLILSLMGSLGAEELCQPEYELREIDTGSSFCRMMADQKFGAASFFQSSFSAFLKGTSFYGANLTNANLQGVNLSSVDLRYATLRNANLQDATLDYANLFKADLTTIPESQRENALVEISDVKRLIQNAIAIEKKDQQMSIGRSSLDTLLRSQQAYRLEYGRFADQISDLDVSIEPQNDYTYAILPQSDQSDSVVLTALSQTSGFKSYMGFVLWQNDNFHSLICEIDQPLTPLSPLDATTDIKQCPTGTRPIE